MNSLEVMAAEVLERGVKIAKLEGDVERLRTALRRIDQMVIDDWPGGEIRACIAEALGINAGLKP